MTVHSIKLFLYHSKGTLTHSALTLFLAPPEATEGKLRNAQTNNQVEIPRKCDNYYGHKSPLRIHLGFNYVDGVRLLHSA